MTESPFSYQRASHSDLYDTNISITPTTTVATKTITRGIIPTLRKRELSKGDDECRKTAISLAARNSIRHAAAAMPIIEVKPIAVTLVTEVTVVTVVISAALLSLSSILT